MVKDGSQQCPQSNQGKKGIGKTWAFLLSAWSFLITSYYPELDHMDIL